MRQIKSYPHRASGVALEPVINFRVACAGSQFFRVQGVLSDGCRVHPSEVRRRNRENWPQPFGLRRKSADTSLSSSSWNRQCLRPPPRLSRFSRATRTAGKLITGSGEEIGMIEDVEHFQAEIQR